MSYGTGRTKPGSAYPVPGASSGYSTGYASSSSAAIGTSGYNSSAYFSKGTSQGSSASSNLTKTYPSSTQFSYTTGNPYEGKSSFPGPGPLSASKFSPSAGSYSGGYSGGRGVGGRGRGGRGGRGRGGGVGGGRGGGVKIVKQKAPPPLSAEERLKIENHNMKQLVAPKPPHRVLNEMTGGGVRFEYTENPPLPPGMLLEDMPALHTLITEVEGDTSTGTGPTHEIAKNICSEHAIMGVVSRRYQNMNDMVSKGLKTKDEAMLEDETPFELASIAVFKMLNEWEAAGCELPPAIEDVLYAPQMFAPVKQRLGWIRGANLGFSTPIQGGVNLSNRKRPMMMPSGGSVEQKNPVAFLNEIRGNVDYQELGTWGTGPNLVFTIGVNIDGTDYSGSGPSKKEAKKACAQEILAKLYKVYST